MTNDARTRFTFRMPKELFLQIKKQAHEKGVSTNALILQILWEWAEKQKAVE